MRENLIQICICILHPYSISRCVLFCVSMNWKEAETWKSEKRSAKGYEVGRKGERGHLKADLGNMQGQHGSEIVAVTVGFCVTYHWHWLWGRNNLFLFFSRNLRLTRDVLNLFTLLVHVRSPWPVLCWRLFKSLERSPSVACCSSGQCACALLTLR